MKLLLDTCTFLWVISGSPRLSARARELFRSPDHEVFLSSASAWEIATILGLSEATVVWRLKKAASKLNAVNKVQAVVNAIRLKKIAV